jgi:hypothetical protein
MRSAWCQLATKPRSAAVQVPKSLPDRLSLLQRTSENYSSARAVNKGKKEGSSLVSKLHSCIAVGRHVVVAFYANGITSCSPLPAFGHVRDPNCKPLHLLSPGRYVEYVRGALNVLMSPRSCYVYVTAFRSRLTCVIHTDVRSNDLAFNTGGLY